MKMRMRESYEKTLVLLVWIQLYSVNNLKPETSQNASKGHKTHEGILSWEGEAIWK